MNSTGLIASPLLSSLASSLNQTTISVLGMDLPRWLSQIQEACGLLLKDPIPNSVLLQDLIEKTNLLDGETKILQSTDLEQKFADIRECLKKGSTAVAKVKTLPPAGYENRSLLQLKMLLDASPVNAPINDNLLQQILGGHFGKGTKLEGYSPQEMLEYILTVLDRKITALHTHPLCSKDEIDLCKTLGLRGGVDSKAFVAMFQQFRQAREVGEGIIIGFDAFSRQLSLKVDQLENGESFFYQGGWATEDSGHAISVEIVKETNDHLTLRLYNRGAGLEFHTQATIAGKNAFLPFTEIVHIPIGNLIRPTMIKSLHGLLQLPPEKYKWDPVDFYQVLLPQLGGELSNKIYTVEHLMESLEVGHCSYLSLTALAFFHLHNPELYQRWEFELQLSTLWNYFEQHQDQLGTSERMRRLLQKSSEQMARTAKTAFFTINGKGHGIINLDEWTLANDKIRQIQEKLKQANEEYLRHDAKLVRPSFHFQKGSLSWDNATALIQPELPNEIAAQKTIAHEHVKFSDPEKLRKAVQKLRNLGNATEIETWMHTTKTIPPEIAGFTSIGQFLRLKEAIQDTVLKMSMDSVLNGKLTEKKEYLTLGSEKEVADTLTMLNDLGRQYLWACMNAASFEPDRAEMTRAADYLTILKLLTLADALIRKYPQYGNTCVALPNLYQWDMGYVLNGRSGASHLYDPRWEKEILILRKHWFPNEKEPVNENYLSFFGFERFPASTQLNPSMNEDGRERLRSFHEKKEERQNLWDGSIEWKDIEWAVKWISRPEIAKKIKAFSPDLAKKSPYWQAVYFLASGKVAKIDYKPFKIEEWEDLKLELPQIFPQSFLTLRELSFAADFILKNRWDPESFTNSKNYLSPFTSYITSWNNDLVTLTQLRPFSALTSAKPEASKTNQPKTRSKIVASDGPYGLDGGQFLAGSQDSLPEFLQNLFLEETSDLSPIHSTAKVPFRRRTNPHWLLEQSPKQVHEGNKLTQEETREILSLSALPERQVVETLAYFKRHRARLGNTEWQQLFRKLMFEPPILLENLLEEPAHSKQFLGQLSEFCRDGILFYEKMGDLQAVSLFLEAGHFFAATARQVAAIDKEFAYILPQGAFPDGLAECKKLLAKEGLSELDRTALHLSQLQMFAGRESIQADEAADLIAASIWTARAQVKKDDSIGARVKSLRDLPLRFQPEIAEALEKDANRVLNEIASQVFLLKVSTNWSREGLLYVSDDGIYRIDPIRARLLEASGKGTMPLPPAFSDDNIFNVTRLQYGRQTEPRVFEGENARKEKYQIVDPGTGALPIIKREIGGKWHRYLKEFPQSLPKAMSGLSFWLEDHPVSTMESLGSMISYPSRTLWASDPETGQIFYEIEAEQTGWTVSEIFYRPKKVYQLDANGKRTGLILANTVYDDGFLNYLKGEGSFEAGTRVLAWVGEDAAVRRIDLPRFDLSFVLNEKKLECEQMKKYFISNEQYISSLDDFSHYLVLEKEEKGKVEKVVLFPRVPFKKLGNGALITDSIPARADDPNKINYFIFNVGQSSCNARTDEGRLYLAMLRLWKHDYSAALKLMTGLGAQIRTYTAGEREILEWIMNLDENNFDYDPRAMAIRQQAGLLLLKNKIDFGGGLERRNKKLHPEKSDAKDDTDFMVSLASLTKDIVQKRDQIPEPFLLAQNDEELVLGAIQSFNPQDEQLKQLLSRLKSRDVKKDAEILIKKIETPKLDSGEIASHLYRALQEQWKKGFSGKTSLLHSSGISYNFVDSYFNAYWAGKYEYNKNKLDQHQRDKLRSYWSSLYKKVLTIESGKDQSTDAIRDETLLALEMIVRGGSDIKEKASAALLLAVCSDPNDFLSPNWFKCLLKDNDLMRKALIPQLTQKEPELAEYLLNRPESRIYEVIAVNQFRLVEKFLKELPGKSIHLSKDPVDRIELEKLRSSETPKAYTAYEECAAIDSSGSMELPKIAYSVDVQKPDEKALETIVSYGKELSQIFDVAANDRVVKQEIERLRNNITAFASSEKAQEPIFTPHPLDEIRTRRGELLVRIAEEEKSLAWSEKKLLELANKNFYCRASDQPEVCAQDLEKRQAALANGDRETISTDELMYLFASQDVDRLLARNRALSKEDVGKVYTQAQKFLLESASLRYQKKLLDQIREYELNVDSIKTNEIELEKLGKLFAELTIVFDKWNADKAKHWLWKAKDFLVFETLAILGGSVPAVAGIAACSTALTNPISATACAGVIVGLSGIGSGYLVGNHYFYTMEDYHKLYDRYGIPRVGDSEVIHYVKQKVDELGAIHDTLLKDQSVLLKDLADLERTKRAYSPETHPEFLVAEHFGEIFFRKEQVEILEKLDWKGGSSGELGSAQEIIMAFGKTSVLLPLMALRNANGERFPLLVMPEALIASMSKELQSYLKKGFNQLIEVFDFNRSPRLKLDQLQRIESRLFSAKKEKKAVLMSGASLQTLALLFLERFSEFNDAALAAGRRIDLAKELDAFRRILVLLRSSADVTMDEMDLLLDVLKANHFTWGSPEALPKDVVETTSSLFEALTTDPELSKEIRWNFDPLSTGAPFTQAKYDAFKPLLIRRILDGRVREGILKPFLGKATADQKRLVEIYLTGAEKRQGEAYAFIAKADLSVKNTLAVLKEQVQKLLPLTAKKQVDEHYGAIPPGADLSGNSPSMAIPYHGSNNPMIGSQFGTDLEILDYTLELHLAKGVSQEIVKKRLEELRSQFIEEGLPTETSVAYKEFLRLGGDAKMNLLHLGIREWERITEAVNHNRKIQFELIRKYILSDIKTYKKQLKTNAQIFPMLVQRIKGCSGTLWNYRTYPETIAQTSFSETEAKTLMCLWKNSKEEGLDRIVPIEHNPQIEGIRRTLEPLYENFTGSFIDLGGIFRGLDNQAVAKEILFLATRKNPEIRGIVFYDAKDHKKVLVKGRDDKAISLDESGLKPKELCAFWDQKHTTGSDITLHPQMKAYLTVSRSTMMRDLLQAAFRLRGLDKWQRVIFAAAKEEGQAIAESLQKEAASGSYRMATLRSLGVKDILLFAKQAEMMRQGDDNLRALPQKLQGALMKPLLDLLLDPAHSWNTLSKYSPLVEELFTHRKDGDLFALYGASEEKIDGMIAVEEEKKRALGNLKTFEWLQRDPLLRQKGDAKQIKKQIEEISEKTKAYVPNEVSRRGKPETDTEVQVENQLEVNTETQKKTSAPPERRSDGRPVVIWPSKKDCFSQSYFQHTPLSRWQDETDELKTKDFPQDLTPQTKLTLLQESKKLDGPAPLVSVDAVVNNFFARKLVLKSSIFDKRLLASLNYMPVYPAQAKQSDYMPFDEHQAVCRHALAIRNSSSGEMKYVMLDAWDALQWEKILKEDRLIPAKKPHSMQVSLFHFDLGVIAEGLQPIPPEVLMGKDSPFHLLNAQAKFISGEINNYSEQEVAALRQWIGQHGADTLRRLFYDRILVWRELSRDAFERSLLGNLLKTE